MPTYQSMVQHALDLLRENKAKESYEALMLLLSAAPAEPMANYLLGTLHLQQREPSPAIAYLETAVAANPNFAEALQNLGTAYRQINQDSAARDAYQRAIELQPDSAELLALMAGSYINTGQPEQAEEWARKALAIDPKQVHGRNHLALALLEQGLKKFDEGFDYYQHRWEVPDRAPMARKYPGVEKWDGGPTRRLVLHGEQGIGDEIMFLTLFGEEARSRVDELVLEATPPLVPLLRRTFGCEVYPTHEEVLKRPKPTAWLPMGDLWNAGFKDPGPYLRPDPVRVDFYRHRLQARHDGLHVGIAWRGGTPNTHALYRQTDLADWKGLFRHASFVSLQYTPEAAEEAAACGIVHWQEAIDDLGEQAALIAALDYVISVPQTAAHMAGAIGTPVWIGCPPQSAWRYGLKGREMWCYPSARLFRMEKPNDWAGVIAEMETELADIAGVHRAKQAAA